MNRYNPAEIEPKWQATWAETKLYEVTEDSDKPKAYVAGMFPYPSGAGLHVGHVRNYAIVDTIARFHRQRGHNVMSPMGWDTFGLPAENYAIKTGTPPAVSTVENIKNFKNQFLRLGMSIDWSREVNTTDPEYYRWTQWIFTKLFEKGLAYQAERLQWWCPHDKTVLANEQVEAGKCWRCGNVVIKKSMKQWFFKITEYADELLDGIDDLDWPEGIKAMQRNWIGKSHGMLFTAPVKDTDLTIQTFSAHFEAFAADTFVVIAPDHPFLTELVQGTEKEKEVLDFSTELLKKRAAAGYGDETIEGIFTGRYITDPVGNGDLPIWVASYALADYGTGIVKCSAHDERDFRFAQKYDIALKPVLFPPDADEAEKVKNLEVCYTDMVHGILTEPGAFDGKHAGTNRENITEYLVEKGIAERHTTYKMHDWLISRQRYWGAPIPIVHCEKDGAVAIPETELPVILPEVTDYEPDGSGTTALGRATDWVNTTCPTCGGPATRETDTMDGYACSSWYYLRYADPHNTEKAWDREKVDYWMPIDFYCGGDHAVSHLLYSRFWTKAFADMGLLTVREPVKKLVYNGYINAPDGFKMSKSKGNVVDPLELIDAGYGADALRVYELFIAPYDLDAAWDPNGIAGTHRFLNRVWNLVQEYNESEKPGEAPQSVVHKTIKKVTDDLERLSFNTAIAAQMELVNELYKAKEAGLKGESWQFTLEALIKLVAPFAPHVADELWQQLGQEGSVHVAPWPTWDDALLVEDTVTIAVQVNGKVRAELTLAKDVSKEDLEAAALANERVQEFVGGKEPERVIVVPGRLVNIVV